jgi:hypothetical protein
VSDSEIEMQMDSRIRECESRLTPFEWGIVPIDVANRSSDEVFYLQADNSELRVLEVDRRDGKVRVVGEMPNAAGKRLGIKIAMLVAWPALCKVIDAEQGRLNAKANRGCGEEAPF